MLHLRAISKYKPPRGYLTEGFLCFIEGLIFGGAYTWRGLFSEFYGNPEMITKTDVSNHYLFIFATRKNNIPKTS